MLGRRKLDKRPHAGDLQCLQEIMNTLSTPADRRMCVLQ